MRYLTIDKETKVESLDPESTEGKPSIKVINGLFCNTRDQWHNQSGERQDETIVTFDSLESYNNFRDSMDLDEGDVDDEEAGGEILNQEEGDVEGDVEEEVLS